MITNPAIDSLLKNNLLKFLPNSALKQVWPSLERVHLELNEVLWDVNERQNYIYFPTKSVVRLLYDTIDGTSIEIATIGKEGFAAGTTVFSNASRVDNRGCVCFEGEAYRIHIEEVEDIFKKHTTFRDICMYYTQTLISQISQNVACGRLNSIKQHLCRYLLTCQDYLETDTLNLTHEYIANHVLGVRRESVSLALAQIRKINIITYSRSKIIILNRANLLANTCECYFHVKDQYDHIFSDYAKKYLKTA